MKKKIEKSIKEIDENLEGCHAKLKDHQKIISENKWENSLPAKQTESYIKGWINALIWITTK